MTGWAEPLYTAGEMRAAEAAHEGPMVELMERAGTAVGELVARRYPDARRVAVWCGGGANGGDGFVAARWLRAAGRDVQVCLLGDARRVTGDAATNLGRAREAGIPFVEEPGPADVIVDALFGTGFSGAPRRDAAAAIETINEAGAAVVAVDVPSGVDASTGEVAGACVRASCTVTFHGRKLGLVVAPGRFHAGDVEIVSIGLAPGETAARLCRPALLEHVPRRGERDNKYSAGAVLVVGGSTGLTGAPCLAAEAALRAGAGVVIACVPASLHAVFEQQLLEVMTRPCADTDGHLAPEAAGQIVELARRVDAVALGPGLGRTDGTRELVRILLDTLDVPVVLDADGLWALAGNLEWVFARDRPTALTPHAGELGRLLGSDSARVNARRLDAVRAGADETGATVLLKGIDTLVAAPGRGTLVADLGTPGLATAGSGDVLAGVVAALLAKGMEPRLGAAAAATLHGVAARRAAALHGAPGMLASDVIPELSRALAG